MRTEKYREIILSVFAAIIIVALMDSFAFSDGKKKKQSKLFTSIVHEQFNFHVVAPGVWRAAVTNEISLRRMHQHGLKTIINFRYNKDFSGWERELSDILGIKYYNYPLDVTKEQNVEELKEILAIMHNPDNQPVLIHCHGGKDRTGMISALYKLQYLNARFEDVYKEMIMYGYDERAFPINIDTVKTWCDKVSCQ